MAGSQDYFANLSGDLLREGRTLEFEVTEVEEFRSKNQLGKWIIKSFQRGSKN